MPTGSREEQAAGAARRRGAYGRVFWCAYLSNAATMVAISLLVRYADLVTHLGGSEMLLGLIVGTGMIGSLLMRLAQGVGIDRFGPRRIWRISLVVFIFSLLGHLLVTSPDGPLIFALRIVMSTSVAGVFGASVTFISRRVPPERMAEIIGTLGTSGFLGILTGPQLADWIMAQGDVTLPKLHVLFMTASALGLVALVFAILATVGQRPPAPRRRPPLLGLLRRYNPGVVLVVAMAVGAGIGMPNTFLRTYTEDIGIEQVGLFFTVYAITAFTTRIATARVPERIGTRPLTVCGLLALAGSVLLYLPVREAWHLAFPAVAAGAAHAFLFPSVVAGASTQFPERHRGVGTTLVMGMFDFGTLLGAPAIGGILALAPRLGLPRYPVMFICMAITLVSVAALFFVMSGRTPPGRRKRRRIGPEHGLEKASVKGPRESGSVRRPEAISSPP